MSKTTLQRIALRKITWVLVIVTLLVSGFITQLVINAATGELRLDLDKTTANVGDIIKCSVKINTISNFAGLQVNIKYDPALLQAVDPNSGVTYTNSSVPTSGDLLLNSAYSPLTIPAHNVSSGILNFGRAYVNLPAYYNKGAGTPETSGTIAIVGFKALKAGNVTIVFQNSATMPGELSGTMIFNWSGNAVSGYSVVQPTAIIIGGPTPTPTRRSNVTSTPTRRSNVTPTPTRRMRVTTTPTRRPSVTPTRRGAATSTPTGRRVNTPTPTPTVSGGYGVSYVIQSDWGNGATISVTIRNNSSAAVNGWTLAWTFPDAQTITNLWNGSYTQNGTAVSVKDAGFNANIPATGGSVNFGFNLNYTGTNAKPGAFSLNGTACQIQ